MKTAYNPRGIFDVIMYSELNNCLITLPVLKGHKCKSKVHSEGSSSLKRHSRDF